jgi:presequence protease
MVNRFGFELVEEREISEVNSRVRLYRHAATGARLLSLVNDDENKVFGVTFPTPPSDSTGLPHILEHSVLCGSRKYPVKEPFVELMKGSLKTFLNAFTMPDRTLYPVASQNLKDFYNLVDVYLDAVFFPLIPEHTLQQEGWHYELSEVSQPLVYKGVVFNEMKGAYSSPEGLLAKHSQQALYPDTIYRHDSGGDPAYIPDLTYDQFRQFHSTFYHPSNAYLFFYGDDPEEKRLQILDSYLGEFSHRSLALNITSQPFFDAPRREVFPYDASDEQQGQKTYLTLNWLLPDTDLETTLGLDILSHVLLGSPAAPLRKVLLESGLGEDLTGNGVDDSLLQLSFSTGMKGVQPENTARLEQLILSTLQDLAANGIDPDTIAASLNTMEFRLRENNTGSYPRGLIVMMRAMRDWIYRADPFSPLEFEILLNALQERVKRGEAYFEGLINSYLIGSMHRVTVVLEPDPELADRREAAERMRLEQARAAMTPADLESIVQSTQDLQKRQQTPDSPAALATIPRLLLADLERTVRTIPSQVIELGTTELLYHELFTNNIVYLDLAFDMRSVPQHLLQYLPLFGRSLVEIGTKKNDFVRLSQQVGQKTGGISPGRIITSTTTPGEVAARFTLGGKATLAHLPDLLDLMLEMLLHVRLDNQERFRQMAMESKARKEASLIPGGHRIVNQRLSAVFNLPDFLGEQLGGLSYLFFLRELTDQINQDWPTVLQALEDLRSHLINRRGLVVNITLDADGWFASRSQIESFLAEIPERLAAPQHWEIAPLPSHEGLVIPAQVNYVGKGANIYDFGYKLDGSLLVINQYLRTTWLWEKIRVQGGAYGGFCTFDQLSGVYNFLSYRDPNLELTLQNYDAAANFLKTLEISPDELTKSIIGVISDLDSYQLPDAKGYTAMIRHLTGMEDTRRQRLRDEVLATRPEDFSKFARILEDLAAGGRVVVLGSQAAINAANQDKNDWLAVQKVL